MTGKGSRAGGWGVLDSCGASGEPWGAWGLSPPQRKKSGAGGWAEPRGARSSGMGAWGAQPPAEPDHSVQRRAELAAQHLEGLRLRRGVHAQEQA